MSGVACFSAVAMPLPKPAHVVVDVGIDQPADVAILGAVMSDEQAATTIATPTV